MTIRVFSPVVPGMQIGDSVEYEGPLLALLRHQESGRTIEEAAADFQVVINGDVIPSRLYSKTQINHDDDVKIIVAAKGGVFKAIGSLLGGLFKVVFGLFGMNPGSDSNDRYSGGQGSTLEASALRSNNPRQGATVPSAYGRVKRFPDMLSEQHRFFIDPRTQVVDVLLHLSIGHLHDVVPYLGDTPLSEIPGCDYWVHPPGSSLAGHPPADLWHSSPAVGGTSGGTAGIVLSSLAENHEFTQAPSYLVSGDQLTAIDGSFPPAWGAGTRFSMVMALDYNLEEEFVGTGIGRQKITKFNGSFKHLLPLTAGKSIFLKPLPISDTQAGAEIFVRDFSVDSDGYGWARFNTMSTGPEPSLVPLNLNESGQRSFAFSQGLSGGKPVFVVTNKNQDTITFEPSPYILGWSGWMHNTNSLISINYDGGDIYGEFTSWFVVSPPGQKNYGVEVDIFFPQGLRYVRDDGSPSDHSVTVEIEFSDADGIVPTKLVRRTYTDATPDQLGFTERFWYEGLAKCRVRMRRLGVVSSDPRVVDEVQWYGLRCLMPEKESYPDWTTMTVRLRSGNQLGSQSENRINAFFTRQLRTLNADGTLGQIQPTRDISAALIDIAGSAGYGVQEWHPDLVRLSQDYWIPRGEHFDFILDETTIKGALDTALAAGFSELTVQDGYLKPVRDVPRTVFDQGFSPQNMIGEVTETTRQHRSDDNDGYEIEFTSEETWETMTVKCLPPGSLGVRLRKQKIEGVIQRHIAWRIGMRMAMADLYRRTGHSFKTPASGLNAFYMDYVSVITSLRNWGQSFNLLHLEQNGDKALLFLSEPLVLDGLQAPFVAAIRNFSDQVLGPFSATVVDEQCIEISGVNRPLPYPTLDKDLPDVYFGQVDKLSHKCLIQSVRPDKGINATIETLNYDERVYTYDDQFPPEQ